MTATPHERARSFLPGTPPAEPACMRTQLGLYLADRCVHRTPLPRLTATEVAACPVWK